jgi:hypothetical protein
MSRTIYCWRCRMELPMLSEEEWSLVEPRLSTMVAHIKQYRDERGCSLEEARQLAGSEALALYEKLNGFKESNANALYHHRLGMYGPACDACGKPLRTPQARFCAMCGTERKTDDWVRRRAPWARGGSSSVGPARRHPGLAVVARPVPRQASQSTPPNNFPRQEKRNQPSQHAFLPPWHFVASRTPAMQPPRCTSAWSTAP